MRTVTMRKGLKSMPFHPIFFMRIRVFGSTSQGKTHHDQCLDWKVHRFQKPKVSLSGSDRDWTASCSDQIPSPGSISIEKTIGPRRTLGFPVKVGGRFFPFSFLSIGLDLQTHLNHTKIIVRPTLSIGVGKLKTFN